MCCRRLPLSIWFPTLSCQCVSLLNTLLLFLAVNGDAMRHNNVRQSGKGAVRLRPDRLLLRYGVRQPARFVGPLSPACDAQAGSECYGS